MKHRKNSVIAFLTLAFFLLVGGAKAQQYYKIPIDTNYYWRQFSLCATVTPVNNVKRLDYQIRYYKDTVINGKEYNKYAPFGRLSGQCCCSSFTEHGYLRQDTLARKVYILDNNFVEQPLYDFTKQVGDTFLHYSRKLDANVTLTVEAIATATLNDDTFHKALWVSNNNCFIEGVGSIFGGLYGDDQMFFTTDNISEQLMCFGIIEPFYKLLDGITQRIYYCAFVDQTVGLSETEPMLPDIRLMPNPTTGKFRIQVNSVAAWNYRIIDLLGKDVLQGIIPANTGTEAVSIDITELPDGIYSVYLTGPPGSLWYQKVVKN